MNLILLFIAIWLALFAIGWTLYLLCRAIVCIMDFFFDPLKERKQ